MKVIDQGPASASAGQPAFAGRCTPSRAFLCGVRLFLSEDGEVGREREPVSCRFSSGMDT
jgi:hypothetical protein